MEAVISFKNVIALDVAYLVFCTFLGPRLMKNRKAFSLKIHLLFYNLFQIAMNAHMFYLCFSMLGIELFNFWSNLCYPVTAANIRPSAREQVLLIHLSYHINKLVDLLDTVFFVLRKKTVQVTVYHVFHHFSMVICTYVTAFHLAAEEIFLKMMALNTFVHVIMHAYYLMSLSPSFQKYLYLKKYIKMIHFMEQITIMVMMLVKLFTCHSSAIFAVLWLSELIILLCLFTNFGRNRMKDK